MEQTALKEENLDVEELIRKYLTEAKSRLGNEFVGTREAIKQISEEKIMEYLVFTDKTMAKKERDLLKEVFVSSMHQAFCYGYGIGKTEEITKKKIYL